MSPESAVFVCRFHAVIVLDLLSSPLFPSLLYFPAFSECIPLHRSALSLSLSLFLPFLPLRSCPLFVFVIERRPVQPASSPILGRYYAESSRRSSSSWPRQRGTARSRTRQITGVSTFLWDFFRVEKAREAGSFEMTIRLLLLIICSCWATIKATWLFFTWQCEDEPTRTQHACFSSFRGSGTSWDPGNARLTNKKR